MPGLIIALLYATLLTIFSGLAPHATYVASTSFLFWWYLIWSVVLCGVSLLIGLLLTTGISVIGAEKAGKLGAALGVAAGGALSLLVFLGFLLQRGLYVGGAYLLSTALTLRSSEPQWDTLRLVLGGAMLLIAIIRSVQVRSSSSKTQ